MNNLHRILSTAFALTLLLAIGGCSTDEPLSGDNYIVDFALMSEDQVYPAKITGERIVVPVPKTLLQARLGARCKLSIGATISPNPKEVPSWSGSGVPFTVKAANGDLRKYTVVLDPQDVTASEQDPTGKGSTYSSHLLTNEDVKRLGESGVNVLIGDLVIGAESGDETISDLSPLKELKEVRYRLVINPTYTGDLSELKNLQRVGELVINGTPPNLKEIILPELRTMTLGLKINDGRSTVERISLPKATEIGTLLCKSPALTTLSAPRLVTLGSLDLASDNLTTLSMDKLQRIVGAFALNGKGKSPLTTLSLPELSSSDGSISISELPQLSELRMPNLVRTSTFTTSRLMLLKELDFSRLERVDQELKLDFYLYNSKNTALTELRLPALKSVGSRLFIRAAHGLTSISLPELEQTNGFWVMEASALQKIEWSNKPKHIGGITFAQTDLAGTVDLSGIECSGLSLNQSWKSMDKLILPNNLERLTFTDHYTNPTEGALPEIEGASKLETLKLERINTRELILPPVLKEIEILDVSGSAFTALSAVGLEKVGELKVESGSVLSISMPILKEAQKVTFDQTTALKSLSFPKLKSIQSLALTGWRGNSSLPNLDGFAEVESIGSVRIEKYRALTDYSGLKNAVAHDGLTEKGWKLEGNGYNPTFEDLKAGRYTPSMP